MNGRGVVGWILLLEIRLTSSGLEKRIVRRDAGEPEDVRELQGGNRDGEQPRCRTENPTPCAP